MIIDIGILTIHLKLHLGSLSGVVLNVLNIAFFVIPLSTWWLVHREAVRQRYLEVLAQDQSWTSPGPFSRSSPATLSPRVRQSNRLEAQLP